MTSNFHIIILIWLGWSFQLMVTLALSNCDIILDNSLIDSLLIKQQLNSLNKVKSWGAVKRKQKYENINFSDKAENGDKTGEYLKSVKIQALSIGYASFSNFF